MATIAFPLSDWTVDSVLQLELGVGLSMIRLTLTQPATSFTHMYFLFPVRARYVYEFSRHWFFSAYAGAMLRLWEYDTRSTTDGGFYKVKTNWLRPDFGLGLDYVINSTFFAQGILGFQHVGIGFGIFI